MLEQHALKTEVLRRGDDTVVIIIIVVLVVVLVLVLVLVLVVVVVVVVVVIIVVVIIVVVIIVVLVVIRFAEGGMIWLETLIEFKLIDLSFPSLSSHWN